MTMPRPSRWVLADDVLAGRVNLDGYPLRYIYLTMSPMAGLSVLGGKAAYQARIDGVFTAVEFLETRGWELVNFEQGGQVAFLRRGVPGEEQAW
jgi:hypothetical protein